jgi:signal peptidase I
VTSGRWRALRDAALALAVVAVLASFILALLTVRVEGLSMMPTLRDGDGLLVDRVWLHRDPPGRGDLVVLMLPNGVLAVKRIIGVPGDTLEIDPGLAQPGGATYPQPAVLLKPAGEGAWRRLAEPYVRKGWVRGDVCCDGRGRDSGRAPAPLTLPRNEFFVLGDNRNASEDSREFGLVPRDRIVARVLARYWPFSRAGSMAPR